jgi:hypothetical protein
LPSGLDAKGISRQLRSETLKALFAR